MNSRKSRFYNLVFVLVILICLFLLIFQNINLTGRITETYTGSNVSITKFFSITFSDNLSSGIDFGNVSVLPATNLNATHNYDGLLNSTTLYIIVSEDGNTPVDFCTKGDGPLTSADLDEIGLNNETYLNSTVNTIDEPGPASNSVALTTSYVKSGYNINLGENNYYRFWLDIPAAQSSGEYNNTVSFKGVQTGDVC